MTNLKMTGKRIGSNKPKQKKKFKARFLTLTDADLQYGVGGMKALFKKIRKRLLNSTEGLVEIIGTQ
jgi:hypothetical protein